MIRLATALSLAVAIASVPPASRADDVEDARAHFRKGAESYRAGRWREAIGEFEAAYRLKPHGAIHFNIAQCRERLGEWPLALRSYEDYLREVPDAKDRAAVRASIHKIEERLASAGVQALLVYSDPPGAALRIDDRPRGPTPFQTVLPPGTYALSLSLDGYEPVSEEVVLAPRAARVVDVVLRPAPPPRPAAALGAAPAPGRAPGAASGVPLPPPPDLRPKPPAVTPGAAQVPPRAKRRVYTWIAAGVAVAAASAGAYFGWSARRDADAIDRMPEPNGADARRYASDAESKARRANVLYAVAGGAAAAGVTLFFVETRF